MAEPTVTQLVATTIQNYHKQFADNVSNSNAVTALLREGNRVRVIEGGRAIACPLTYAEETFAWYLGTELLSRATKETISEAHYDPANAVASVTLSGQALAQDSSTACASAGSMGFATSSPDSRRYEASSCQPAKTGASASMSKAAENSMSRTW